MLACRFRHCERTEGSRAAAQARAAKRAAHWAAFEAATASSDPPAAPTAPEAAAATASAAVVAAKHAVAACPSIPALRQRLEQAVAEIKRLCEEGHAILRQAAAANIGAVHEAAIAGLSSASLTVKAALAAAKAVGGQLQPAAQLIEAAGAVPGNSLKRLVPAVESQGASAKRRRSAAAAAADAASRDAGAAGGSEAEAEAARTVPEAAPLVGTAQLATKKKQKGGWAKKGSAGSAQSLRHVPPAAPQATAAGSGKGTGALAVQVPKGASAAVAPLAAGVALRAPARAAQPLRKVPTPQRSCGCGASVTADCRCGGVQQCPNMMLVEKLGGRRCSRPTVTFSDGVVMATCSECGHTMQRYWQFKAN